MSERGVYFRREDCAGFIRRLLVDGIDLGVALVAYVGLAVPVALLTADESRLPGRLALLAGLLWLGYFVLLKWSRFGTLGYRLGAVRLTSLQGGRPSFFAVLLRAALMALGPLNYLLDLVWLTGDPQRQALRDKFAHTYVVRARATPVGEAHVHHVTYNFGGLTFNVPEVRVPPAGTATDASGLPA